MKQPIVQKLGVFDFVKMAAATVTATTVLVTATWFVLEPHLERLIAQSLPADIKSAAVGLKDIEKRIDRVEMAQESLKDYMEKQEANMEIIIFMLRRTDLGEQLNVEKLRQDNRRK